MTQFHYTLPESEPTPSLGGLSEEARRALTEGAMGPSPADKLLKPDGDIVNILSYEELGWLNAELLGTDSTGGALDSWQRYKDILGVTAPRSVPDLEACNPNLAKTVNRLYEAKQALIASGETTPEGKNVGKTMHLTLIPWQEIRNHLADFDRWVKTLRDSQGIATSDDFINERLLRVIKSNQPMYRDTVNPSQTLTPTEYLDRKITEDGPWGVMLMQTSKAAGIERITGQSPDKMTSNGVAHLEIAGSKVDAMGIFEWIALTIQKDPKKLSPKDISLLLANRMTFKDVPFVSCACWCNVRVRSHLDWANLSVSNVRVRLAVRG